MLMTLLFSLLAAAALVWIAVLFLDGLHPGVRVLPPRGDFVIPATATASALVLVGGGIGITPMRAMLHEALADSRARRPILLFHAARHAAELLYRDEFEALAAQHSRFAYRPILSRPDAGWRGACGRLDSIRLLAALTSMASATQFNESRAAPPLTPSPSPARGEGSVVSHCATTPWQRAHAEFCLCAGMDMMEALRDGLMASGIDPARIHREAFGVAAGAAVAGRRIVVEQDGQVHEIVSADEPSLLATLEAHDLAPPSECRAGTCGECRMTLVAGEVRWLLPAGVLLAANEVLPCVCAAEGDLRLNAHGVSIPAYAGNPNRLKSS